MDWAGTPNGGLLTRNNCEDCSLAFYEVHMSDSISSRNELPAGFEPLCEECWAGWSIDDRSLQALQSELLRYTNYTYPAVETHPSTCLHQPYNNGNHMAEGISGST